MKMETYHCTEVVFARRDRAAEAVAWLFANVEVFRVKTSVGPQIASLKVRFAELSDGAKFKMMFGDDDTDNTI